jgi:hypothetical protein
VIGPTISTEGMIVAEVLMSSSLVDVFFVVYGFFGCLCLDVLHMKTPMAHEEHVSEKCMMGMQWVQKYHWSMRDLIYPSSTGTLTCVEPR